MSGFNLSKEITKHFRPLRDLSGVHAVLCDRDRVPLLTVYALRVEPEDTVVIERDGLNITVDIVIYTVIDGQVPVRLDGVYCYFEDLPDVMFSIAGFKVISESLVKFFLIERQHGGAF